MQCDFVNRGLVQVSVNKLSSDTATADYKQKVVASIYNTRFDINDTAEVLLCGYSDVVL